MIEYIKSLLDCKAESGKQFTEEDAAYDIATGGAPEFQVDRAQRWGWSQSRVSKKLGILVHAANGIKAKWNILEYEIVENDTEKAENKDSWNILEYETITKEKKERKEKEISPHTPLSEREKVERKERPPPKRKIHKKKNPPPQKPEIDWSARYAQVMDSWNTFAQKHDLPQLRKLSPDRKRWIKAKYDEIMPHIDEIYQNLEADDFLMGRTEQFRGMTFETLWRYKDRHHKYLEMTPRQKHFNGVHLDKTSAAIPEVNPIFPT